MLVYFPGSLGGVHHVTMCNWPAVTPELCKQISRETCQPEGRLEWMCAQCVNHRCEILWEMCDGVKP